MLHPFRFHLRSGFLVKAMLNDFFEMCVGFESTGNALYQVQCLLLHYSCSQSTLTNWTLHQFFLRHLFCCCVWFNNSIFPSLLGYWIINVHRELKEDIFARHDFIEDTDWKERGNALGHSVVGHGLLCEEMYEGARYRHKPFVDMSFHSLKLSSHVCIYYMNGWLLNHEGPTGYGLTGYGSWQSAWWANKQFNFLVC